MAEKKYPGYEPGQGWTMKTCNIGAIMGDK